MASLPDLINKVMATPYTKKRSGDNLANSAGGRDKRKAHSKALASFVAQAKRSKIKNATPMYALTLKKRQNPIPVNVNSKRLKISSSLRKRHFNNFCNKAFKATVNKADSKKQSAAIKIFCAVALSCIEKGVG